MQRRFGDPLETLSPNNPNTLKPNRERRRIDGVDRSADDSSPSSSPWSAAARRRFPRVGLTTRHATVQRPEPPGQVRPHTEKQNAPRITRQDEGARRRAKGVFTGPATAGRAPPWKAGSGPRTPRPSSFFRAAPSILTRAKIRREMVVARMDCASWSGTTASIMWRCGRRFRIGSLTDCCGSWRIWRRRGRIWRRRTRRRGVWAGSR